MNSRYLFVIWSASVLAFNLFGVVFDLIVHSYWWAAWMAFLSIVSGVVLSLTIRDLKP